MHSSEVDKEIKDRMTKEEWDRQVALRISGTNSSNSNKMGVFKEDNRFRNKAVDQEVSNKSNSG